MRPQCTRGHSLLQVVAIQVLLAGVTYTSGSAQYGAKAVVDRDAGRMGRNLEASTRIETEQTLAPHQSLADVASQSPGVRIRDSGGLGANASLSLRGADPVHTAVLLGDIPVSTAAGGSFDLSLVPPSLLDSVETYRGGGPIWLGAGGAQGLLRLVPRYARKQSLEMRASGGAFGRASGSATASLGGANGRSETRGNPGEEGASDAGGETPQLLAHLGFDRADNDFPYRDENSPLDPNDDETRRRENAQAQQAQGLINVRAPAFGGHLRGVSMSWLRSQGVPGPASLPTRSVSMQQMQTVNGIGFDTSQRDGKLPWHFESTLALTLARRQVDDPLGEIGPAPTEQDDQEIGVFLRTALELEISDHVRSLTSLSGQWQSFDPQTQNANESSDASTDQPSVRRFLSYAGQELVFEQALGSTLLTVRPGLQVGIVQSTEASGTDGAAPPIGITTTPRYQVASRLDLVEYLGLVGTVGYRERVPTLFELYGDRAFVLGNTSLSEETTLGGDFGATGSYRVPLKSMRRTRSGSVWFDYFEVAGESRFFGNRMSNLIRYTRTAQFTVRPDNLDDARVLGLEKELHLRLGDQLHGYGTLTYLKSRNLSFASETGPSRELPLRPRLVAYAAIDLQEKIIAKWLELRAQINLRHMGANFVDEANRVRLPSRTRFGANLRLSTWEGRVSASVGIDDITDARGTDLIGFPLPGRAWSAGIASTLAL